MRFLFALCFCLYSATSLADWKYQKSKDEMVGAIYSASTNSKNTLNFSFPYQGAQPTTLELRDHPRWGVSVILSVRRGQFNFSDDEDCGVLIKFDDDVNTWSCRLPMDGSHDTIFLGRKFEFISDAKKSKRLFIEASFYSEGTRVIEFDVSKLKWPLVERELEF